MAERRLARWIATLFALALVVRLVVLGIHLQLPHPSFVEPDSPDYVREASDLAHGRGLLTEEGSPSMLRPPGYSAWLAALFALNLASPSSPWGAVLLQILLSAGIVAMACALAWRIAGAKAALLCGLLIAFEPASVSFPIVLLSETLYTFLLMLLPLVWMKWQADPKLWKLLLMAGLTGILSLVRPVGLYLPFLLTLFVAAAMPASKRLRTALLFLALSLVPSSAWRVRNEMLLGTPEFSSIGPWNKALFACSVAEASGQEEGIPGPWDRTFGKEQGLSIGEIMKIQEDTFRTLVRKHPWLTLARAGRNAVYLAGVPNDLLVRLCLEKPPELAGGSVLLRLRWMAAVGWLSVFLLLGMIVSVAGLISLPLLAARRGAPERTLAALLVALALYHWLLSSAVELQGDRFRAPIVPILAVSLAAALSPRCRRDVARTEDGATR